MANKYNHILFLLMISMALWIVVVPQKASCRNLSTRQSQNPDTRTTIYPINTEAPSVPGRIIIKRRESSLRTKGAVDLNSFMDVLGVTGKRPAFPWHQRLQSPLSNIYEITISADQNPASIAQAVMQHPDVIWAEPIYLHKIAQDPNDPHYSEQWYLSKIQMDLAWEAAAYETTDPDSAVLIGIVDTGVNIYHPDLEDNIWTNPGEIPNNGLDDDGNGYVDDVNGWDFGDNDNDPTPGGSSPDRWHGTGMAGVAAAVTDNQEGIASPSLNVKILPVKVSEDSDYDQGLLGYPGIVYAVDMGADIVNMSFGSYVASNAEREVVAYALEKGVFLVAAAGNEDTEDVHYPSGYNGVLSIGATDSQDLRASFSDYGPTVDMCAPGVSILTTWLNTAYESLQGTSLSTPLVAGVGAFLMNNNPDWTGLQVREQIRVTADPIDDENPEFADQLGSGRLNAYRAYTERGPAIRISNIQFEEETGNINGIPEPDEQMRVTFDVTNYLEPVSNIEIQLTTTDSAGQFDDTFIQIDYLGTMEIWRNTAQPAQLVISPSIERGTVINVTVQIIGDNGYTDRDHFSFQIAPPFINVKSTNVEMTTSGSGRFGFVDYPYNQLGDGFVLKDWGNLLFEGAFMAATGPESVSDVARNEGEVEQNKDFASVPGGDVTLYMPGRYGDEEAVAVFSDEAASSKIGLQVEQRVMSFETEGAENLLMAVYALSTTGDAPICDVYAGLFADWDVGDDPADNEGGYVSDLSLGYVFDPDSSIYAGMQVVSQGGARAHQLIRNEDVIYEGYSDEEKWLHLSEGVSTTTGSIPSDYSDVIGSGPFIIFPGDTVRLGIALHGATGLSALRSSAETAIDIWQSLFPDEPEYDFTRNFVLHHNFPNPFTDHTTIQYDIPICGQVRLTIYDIIGRQVTRLVDRWEVAGFSSAIWDGRGPNGTVADGVYIYKLEIADQMKSGKIIFIH